MPRPAATASRSASKAQASPPPSRHEIGRASAVVAAILELSSQLEEGPQQRGTIVVDELDEPGFLDEAAEFDQMPGAGAAVLHPLPLVVAGSIAIEPIPQHSQVPEPGDEKLGQDYDYTAKDGIVHREILLPEGAPARWLDRGTLWNEVEAGEKRKDAQLARDIEISLPRELAQAEAIRLVRDFVREQFVARGMVADLNVHWTQAADGALQPHAHVMLTMRRLEPVLRAGGNGGHDRDTDRERDLGGSARRAWDIPKNTGVDGGAVERSDRGDDRVAATHSPGSANDFDAAGDHRASTRLGRVIAAARLRSGFSRQSSVAREVWQAGRSEELGFGAKETAWNDRALLRGWRERWAELANARLAELGHDIRIDHRSYADQGIDLEPQHKIGPAGRRREDRGENAERAAEHRAIARRNGETLLAEPEIALRALTQQHSTFTRPELARLVNRHTDDAEQFSAVMAKVETSPDLVRVGEDGRGRERFTTREMVQAEHRMEGAAAGMAGRDGHAVSPAAVWRAQRAAERSGLVLGDEQKAALTQVTSGSDLALVVGYAGTGKSAMFSVARAAWEAEGYQVQGLALSGIAAEGFEAGAGIASRTIASLGCAWAQGRDALTPRDVLVIDEAGMVGSRQMERVLSAAQSAGAKVVLVGDPEQLQAIEAGAAFRALAERHGAAEITAVRRQRAEWKREATRELATGRTEAALGRYAAAGMVQAAPTREGARAALVAGWTDARLADAGAAGAAGRESDHPRLHARRRAGAERAGAGADAGGRGAARAGPGGADRTRDA